MNARVVVSIVVSLLFSPRPGTGQETDERVQRAFEDRRWDDVIAAAQAIANPEAAVSYDYGMALAHRERWQEARAVFLRGQRTRPRDERFPVELAGLAFKQQHYAEAAHWLRRAIRLDPSDSYAVDFLGTVYFLQGNLEAALKYWNRIGKPRLDAVTVPPGLQTDPVLLDRLFTFAPAETLSVPALLTTEARLQATDIFTRSVFHLDAREDGGFDVNFSAVERDGMGNGKTQAVVSALRGIGYETVYPEYFNLGGSNMNIESLVRWDAEKRRLWSSVSAPFEDNPKYRYRVGLDLRDENWALTDSIKGSAPILDSFRMRRIAMSSEVTSTESGNWGWSAGGELSYRDFGNIAWQTGTRPGILAKGYQLKQTAEFRRVLWRAPERRFESNLRLSSEAGTIWAARARTFERLQGGISARWLPRMSGDDYAMHQQIRIGGIFGAAPFDELFMLGMERDNDLWMRAHPGTRDGRKGSAPMGVRYFLSNWEVDKNLLTRSIVSVKLSPFVDSGSMDSPAGLGSAKWLWDTGVQLKLRVLGVGLAFIYGRDLRSGGNTTYFAGLP